MQIASQMVALVMFLVGAVGCSEDMPLRATYEPAGQEVIALGDDVTAEAVEVAEPVELVKTHGTHRGVPPQPQEEAVEMEEKPEADSSPKTAGAGDPIDINSATALELTRLPGVGPALAERIVEYREKRPFEKIADIQRVRGIGPAKFAKMKDLLLVR